MEKALNSTIFLNRRERSTFSELTGDSHIERIKENARKYNATKPQKHLIAVQTLLLERIKKQATNKEKGTDQEIAIKGITLEELDVVMFICNPYLEGFQVQVRPLGNGLIDVVILPGNQALNNSEFQEYDLKQLREQLLAEKQSAANELENKSLLGRALERGKRIGAVARKTLTVMGKAALNMGTTAPLYLVPGLGTMVELRKRMLEASGGKYKDLMLFDHDFEWGEYLEERRDKDGKYTLQINRNDSLRNAGQITESELQSINQAPTPDIQLEKEEIISTYWQRQIAVNNAGLTIDSSVLVFFNKIFGGKTTKLDNNFDKLRRIFANPDIYAEIKNILGSEAPELFELFDINKLNQRIIQVSINQVKLVKFLTLLINATKSSNELLTKLFSNTRLSELSDTLNNVDPEILDKVEAKLQKAQTSYASQKDKEFYNPNIVKAFLDRRSINKRSAALSAVAGASVAASGAAGIVGGINGVAISGAFRSIESAALSIDRAERRYKELLAKRLMRANGEEEIARIRTEVFRDTALNAVAGAATYVMTLGLVSESYREALEQNPEIVVKFMKTTGVKWAGRIGFAVAYALVRKYFERDKADKRSFTEWVITAITAQGMFSAMDTVIAQAAGGQANLSTLLAQTEEVNAYVAENIVDDLEFSSISAELTDVNDIFGPDEFIQDSDTEVTDNALAGAPSSGIDITQGNGSSEQISTSAASKSAQIDLENREYEDIVVLSDGSRFSVPKFIIEAREQINVEASSESTNLSIDQDESDLALSSNELEKSSSARGGAKAEGEMNISSTIDLSESRRFTSQAAEEGADNIEVDVIAAAEEPYTPPRGFTMLPNGNASIKMSGPIFTEQGRELYAINFAGKDENYYVDSRGENGDKGIFMTDGEAYRILYNQAGKPVGVVQYISGVGTQMLVGDMANLDISDDGSSAKVNIGDKEINFSLLTDSNGKVRLEVADSTPDMAEKADDAPALEETSTTIEEGLYSKKLNITIPASQIGAEGPAQTTMNWSQVARRLVPSTINLSTIGGPEAYEVQPGDTLTEIIAELKSERDENLDLKYPNLELSVDNVQTLVNSNLTSFQLAEVEEASAFQTEDSNTTVQSLFAGKSPYEVARTLQVGAKITIDGQEYIVQPGDTVTGIIAKSGAKVSVEDFITQNPEAFSSPRTSVEVQDQLENAPGTTPLEVDAGDEIDSTEVANNEADEIATNEIGVDDSTIDAGTVIEDGTFSLESLLSLEPKQGVDQFIKFESDPRSQIAIPEFSWRGPYRDEENGTLYRITYSLEINGEQSLFVNIFEDGEVVINYRNVDNSAFVDISGADTIVWYNVAGVIGPAEFKSSIGEAITLEVIGGQTYTDVEIASFRHAGFSLDSVTLKEGGATVNISGSELDATRIEFAPAGNITRVEFIPDPETLSTLRINAGESDIIGRLRGTDTDRVYYSSEPGVEVTLDNGRILSGAREIVYLAGNPRVTISEAVVPVGKELIVGEYTFTAGTQYDLQTYLGIKFPNDNLSRIVAHGFSLENVSSVNFDIDRDESIQGVYALEGFDLNVPINVEGNTIENISGINFKESGAINSLWSEDGETFRLNYGDITFSNINKIYFNEDQTVSAIYARENETIEVVFDNQSYLVDGIDFNSDGSIERVVGGDADELLEANINIRSAAIEDATEALPRVTSIENISSIDLQEATRPSNVTVTQNGDEVKVEVEIDGIDYGFALNDDTESLSFENLEKINGRQVIEGGIGTENPSVKAVYVPAGDGEQGNGQIISVTETEGSLNSETFEAKSTEISGNTYPYFIVRDDNERPAIAYFIKDGILEINFPNGKDMLSEDVINIPLVNNYFVRAHSYQPRNGADIIQSAVWREYAETNLRITYFNNSMLDVNNPQNAAFENIRHVADLNGIEYWSIIVNNKLFVFDHNANQFGLINYEEGTVVAPTFENVQTFNMAGPSDEKPDQSDNIFLHQGTFYSPEGLPLDSYYVVSRVGYIIEINDNYYFADSSDEIAETGNTLIPIQPDELGNYGYELVDGVITPIAEVEEAAETTVEPTETTAPVDSTHATTTLDAEGLNIDELRELDPNAVISSQLKFQNPNGAAVNTGLTWVLENSTENSLTYSTNIADGIDLAVNIDSTGQIKISYNGVIITGADTLVWQTIGGVNAIGQIQGNSGITVEFGDEIYTDIDALSFKHVGFILDSISFKERFDITIQSTEFSTSKISFDPNGQITTLLVTPTNNILQNYNIETGDNNIEALIDKDKRLLALKSDQGVSITLENDRVLSGIRDIEFYEGSIRSIRGIATSNAPLNWHTYTFDNASFTYNTDVVRITLLDNTVKAVNVNGLVANNAAELTLDNNGMIREVAAPPGRDLDTFVQVENQTFNHVNRVSFDMFGNIERVWATWGKGLYLDYGEISISNVATVVFDSSQNLSELYGTHAQTFNLNVGGNNYVLNKIVFDENGRIVEAEGTDADALFENSPNITIPTVRETIPAEPTPDPTSSPTLEAAPLPTPTPTAQEVDVVQQDLQAKIKELNQYFNFDIDSVTYNGEEERYEVLTQDFEYHIGIDESGTLRADVFIVGSDEPFIANAEVSNLRNETLILAVPQNIDVSLLNNRQSTTTALTETDPRATLEGVKTIFYNRQAELTFSGNADARNPSYMALAISDGFRLEGISNFTYTAAGLIIGGQNISLINESLDTVLTTNGNIVFTYSEDPEVITITGSFTYTENGQEITANKIEISDNKIFVTKADGSKVEYPKEGNVDLNNSSLPPSIIVLAFVGTALLGFWLEKQYKSKANDLLSVSVKKRRSKKNSDARKKIDLSDKRAKKRIEDLGERYSIDLDDE